MAFFQVKVNASRTIEALQRIKDELPEANYQGVMNMAKDGVRFIQTVLESGSPLHMRSGALAGSVKVTFSEMGGLTSRARVAPTTVYARIQELGGVSGKDYHSHLPPRPYVRPAILGGMDKFRDDAIEAIRGVL